MLIASGKYLYLVQLCNKGSKRWKAARKTGINTAEIAWSYLSPGCIAGEDVVAAAKSVAGRGNPKIPYEDTTKDGFSLAENTDDLFVGKTLLKGMSSCGL